MDLQEELRGFKFGAQASMETDNTPLESTPFGWNTALRSIGNGSATLGTRPGLKIVNTTALTSSPAFFLIKNYPYYSTLITNKLALVTAIGRLYFKDGTNTIGSEIVPPSDFPYTAGHAFASGDFAIDAAVMNNRLFMVNTNGERRSVLNETFKMFGLDHLGTIALANVATGSSSMPAETYDVVVTTYDSATGAESSSSPVQSVTLGANERIRVTATISAAETARYSHWRVYLRRQTTQSNLFRVLVLEDVGGSGIVSDGNIPIATDVVYIDLTATQISQLVLVAPSETENNEPLATCRYITAYGGRLVLADLQNFYWSKLGLPDAFPPLNAKRLDTGEGDEIRGLHEFSDDLLLIFTANNVWGVFGNDPQSWTIKPVDHNVGCASHRSIVEVPGGVMWWSMANGPVFFDGTQTIKIGLDKLGTTICQDDVEGSRLPYVVGGFDPQGQRALQSYSLLSATRNTAILPFNARQNEFEATRWNPMDMSGFGMGYDTDSKQKLFCGNYAGQLFVLDSETLNDAVPSGTITGTFTPATTGPTTITSSGFYTTGAGLTERYVVVKNSSGQIVGRERISSNTSTVLTLASALSLTAGELHTFDVGGQDFRLYTKQFDFQQAFRRKRVDNVYVHIRSANDTDTLSLSTFINYGVTPGTFYTGWTNSGDVFDSETAIWDTSVWGGSGEAKKRFRIIRNCHAIQVGLFHSQANKDFVILKIGALARQLSDRYYG
jgi:hypothetical protein